MMLRFSSVSLLAGSALLSLWLSGCQPPEQAPLPPRAVRTMVVDLADISPDFQLAGEVKARVESRLGFQVGGRLATRNVNLGQRVRKGDVLASIDPRDLRLAQQAAQARVESARAEFTLAQTERDRFAELRKQEVVPQNALDAKEATLSAARSRFEEAKTQLEMQDNQKDYSHLKADADGVVVGVDADAGEVVAVGQPIIRIAHEGQLEVEVVFPEDKLQLAKVATATVTLWAKPEQQFPTVLRELSASADPVTRTFVARYSISNAAPEMQIGQTAILKLKAPTRQAVALPTTALIEHEGKSQVWLFDAAKSAVHRRPIEVLGVDENRVLVSGLEPGQVVITAGVHVLMEGQVVTLLAQDTRKDAVDASTLR